MILGVHGVVSSKGQSASPMFGLFGYAAEAGGTTGGAGGSTVTTTNFADFKAACQVADTPMIIKYAPTGGVATGVGYIDVGSNKTILGALGSSLEGCGLLMYTKHNVIIRNMNIKKVQTYSNIVVKEGSHHVWVDHCDLSSDLTHGYDFYDGLLDIGNESDYVTATWNKLHDNPIANLIGFSPDRTTDAGLLKTTLYGNHYYNNIERNPSTLWGDVHMMNNYLEDITGYSTSVSLYCRMRIDNNSMERVNNPFRNNFNPNPTTPIPGEFSGLETNKLVDCGDSFVLGNSASTFRPPYQYSQYLLPKDDVKAIVLANSGAILNLV